MAFGTNAVGSERCASNAASDSCRSSSNSAASNADCRSSSPSSRSEAGRFSRTVVAEPPVCSAPPPRLPLIFKRSLSSRISWRERSLVPRVSIMPAKAAAVALPAKASSVPWRKE